jgi:hypothetical protein
MIMNSAMWFISLHIAQITTAIRICLSWLFHSIADGSFVTLDIQRIEQVLNLFSSFSLNLGSKKGLETWKDESVCCMYGHVYARSGLFVGRPIRAQPGSALCSM